MAIGRSGLVSTKPRHAPKAGLLHVAPVNNPVLRIERRRNRCGRCTATRRPIGPPQSWTTAGVGEIEMVDERQHRCHEALVGVEAGIRRLVGLAEPGIVGGYDAVARRHERRDHVPVQERPGRLTVKEHDG